MKLVWSESLSDRRLYFFNIVHLTSPKYLSDLLPEKRRSLNPQRSELFIEFFSHSAFFDSSFFPFCVKTWNKLSSELRNSSSVSIFKKALLNYYRPKECSIFNIFDPVGLKLFTRLRVNLSHVREHKSSQFS